MNDKVMKEFQEFGSRMHIIAILSILTFVIPLVGLIQLVFIFLALGNIRRIYYEMPNPHLMEFRSKYIISFIISLCGTTVMLIGTVSGVMSLIGLIRLPYNNLVIRGVLTAMIVIIIIGVIFIIISGYIEYKAWENLMIFFENNRTMFPEMISKDAIDGARNLKTGTIFNMTIILAIVGVILRIIGYFRLASLKKLYNTYDQPASAYSYTAQPAVQTQAQSVMEKTPGGITNFCIHCGTKIERDVKFCYSCGSHLES